MPIKPIDRSVESAPHGVEVANSRTRRSVQK
jgi:hypothetical protein